MISDWMFPWESPIMVKHPLAMPIFMVILALVMSLITWKRKG